MHKVERAASTVSAILHTLFWVGLVYVAGRLLDTIRDVESAAGFFGWLIICAPIFGFAWIFEKNRR